MANTTEQPDDSWVQRYYEQPRPEQFEEEVTKWQQAGVLHSAAALPTVTAFLSRMFQVAPAAQLDRWIAFVRSLPRVDQKPFLIALWWADTSDARETLRTFISQAGPGAAGLEELLHLPPPDFARLSDPTPEELDLCWGAFFATGDAAYVLPIIRCAATPLGESPVDPAQQAARWSLKSLCAAHERLREIRGDFYEAATPEQRRSLDQLFKE